MCSVAICNPGRANCDGAAGNGCETLLDINPACGSTSLGQLPGDAVASTAESGVGESSFRLNVIENDNGLASHDLSVRFSLVAPPGVSYRLEANCDGCGTTGVDNSTVTLRWQEQTDVFGLPNTNSSRNVFVNVTYVSGSSCQPWQLQVQTDVPASPVTCSPR